MIWFLHFNCDNNHRDCITRYINTFIYLFIFIIYIMIDNESQITFEFNSTFSRLFTSIANVFLKVKLDYSNQQLTLIKIQITRMIEKKQI